MNASHVTTHVLDTAAGRPAAGVPVQLHVRGETGWTLIGSGTTDADGRAKQLGPERLTAGDYQLRFDTDAYFARSGTKSFFPEVILGFRLDATEEHYHVPLLLSPFAFSAYRGS